MPWQELAGEAGSPLRHGPCLELRASWLPEPPLSLKRDSSHSSCPHVGPRAESAGLGLGGDQEPLWLGLDRSGTLGGGHPRKAGLGGEQKVTLAKALARAVESCRELASLVACPPRKAEPGSRVLGCVVGLEAS